MNIRQPLRSLLVIACAAVTAMAAEPPQSIEHAIVVGKPAVPIVVGGELDYPAEAVAGRTGSLVIGEDDSVNYQVRMQMMLALNSWTDFHLFPSDLEKPATTPSAYRAVMQHGRAGYTLAFSPYDWDAQEKKYAIDRAGRRNFFLTRNDRKSLANIAADDIEKVTYPDRFLDVRIDVTDKRLVIWIENNAAFSAPMPQPGHGKMYIGLNRGTRVRQIEVTPFVDDQLLTPIAFGPSANDTFSKRIPNKQITLGGVTFDLPEGGRDHLSLLDAQWVDQQRDPPNYYSLNDGGPYVLGDKRMPFLRVPLADYAAIHLLAYAEDDAEKYSNNFTIRAGRYGYNSQVVQQDFEGSVPRAADAASIDESQKIETPVGPLFHVRMPLDRAFAQDVHGGILEIELTKQLEVTRHHPDPNRFRFRPVGLPSGVRIVAATFEKSPLQIKVTSDEVGHAFVQPQKPVFHVHLTNITDQPQPYALSAVATHHYGQSHGFNEVKGTVDPGATKVVDIPIGASKRGYHDVVITLKAADGKVVLNRHTSYALLMPDNRQHRATAPWGSWTWAGAHFTSTNADDTGQLFVKLGFRFGMGGDPIEARQKYGVTPGNEPRVEGGIEAYEKYIAARPDTPKTGLIFHENSISGPHVTRTPDLFHDRPAYKLNEKEQERFDKMWEMAIEGATAVREKYPDVFLKFGNGPLPTKEEFYRAKFPAELFDAAGNEPGSYGRLPERQPPDYVAYNASIWMDEQLLQHYGYGDKPVRQCYEVGYPGDNPGNVDSRDQADYFVRHVLHAMAWEMPFIHLGEIIDVGNSYYYSNWGAAGFCKAYPEMNVKPAYVQLAVMTSMLDGVKLHKIHDAGSDSLYAIEFVRADGQHVLAYWTTRGSRPITVATTGTWTHFDDQGNETQSPTAIVATPSPQWLIGPGDVGAITCAAPTYDDAPAEGATIVAPLASLNDWTLHTTRDAELEFYNFLTPRRKGDFTFTPAGDAIRITPKPIDYGKDTMPMYAVLEHATGIELPGSPENLGIWINGNSGWGRIIYEVTDANGERWTSIGAQANGEPNPWLLDWMSAEMLAQLGTPKNNDWNTNDSHGISSINFDGWRYVAFPLPGNYPHENHHKPANNWWRHSDDGVVQYPLTLRKVIVEIPEKVLHLKTWQAPRNPTIEIKNITAE